MPHREENSHFFVTDFFRRVILYHAGPHMPGISRNDQKAKALDHDLHNLSFEIAIARTQPQRPAGVVAAGQLYLTGRNRQLNQVPSGSPFTIRDSHCNTGALNHRSDSSLE
jgi:hypothetical protein